MCRRDRNTFQFYEDTTEHVNLLRVLQDERGIDITTHEYSKTYVDERKPSGEQRSTTISKTPNSFV